MRYSISNAIPHNPKSEKHPYENLVNTGVPGVCSIDYNSNSYSYPRGPVLEQNPVPDDDDPLLDEVLGPHQPDAQPKEAKI